MRPSMLTAGLLFALLAGCLGPTEGVEEPEHTVGILDNRFVPTDTTVPLNASLVFIHRGESNHTVTVRVPGGQADEFLFDVEDPGLATGNRVALQFPDAGQYVVFCRYHSDGTEGMLVRVTVT